MKTKTKNPKKHPIQNDPAYNTLTPALRADIDSDIKGIAKQEAINGGLKWGLVAIVGVLVLFALVM